MVVTPALRYLLARTPIGKSMRATADNRDLAAVAGIDVDRIGRQVWFLAGALAGLGGVMSAVVQGVFDPTSASRSLFMIFTTVVLGGIGSAYGALVAGFIARARDGTFDLERIRRRARAKFKPVLAFVALILLLLWRPQGLFGRARVL